MTEPRRRWFVDPFDDDDPAVRRLRDAIAPRPVDAPQGAGKAAVTPDTTPDPQRAQKESQTRRGRIAQLVARVRAGDLAGVDLLRRALDRE
jgi:hypothetical protein